MMINEEENLELETPSQESNNNTLELDLEHADISKSFSVLYEDDSFRVLHPNDEEGALYIFNRGEWGFDGEDNWRMRQYDTYYVIEEKTGKKRCFLFKDGYGDIFSPSGARYSCATWVSKNGTNGLKRWFVAQNFPYITTNLKKKLGAEYIGETNTYTYPTDDDPGYSARRKSTQITKINIVQGTESIKDIGGFKSVKTLIIPEGVKRIGRYACSGLSSLENLYLPDTLQRIGERAFVGSESLKSVFIPKSVTKINGYIFESSKWYSDYRHNTEDIVDPNTLTIYCEVKEKPSGWDERWNACQYTGSRQSARGYESVYSMYPVVWGASRPTMNMEEDLDIDSSYPEYDDDNLSMEYVEAILDKYFELEKNSKEYLITPEEEERRRSNCYHPWGHNINNYFVRTRGDEVLLIGETDEENQHFIDIVNLPTEKFKDVILSINPNAVLDEDLDIEVAPPSRTQKIRKRDIVVPHGTDDLRSRHLKSYEITDDSKKEGICDILDANYLKSYISYPTQWIVYKYVGNSSIGYILDVHPFNGDYYCDMENKKSPAQRYVLSPEQVDEIEAFLNINLREDLELEPTDIDTSFRKYFVGPEERCEELIKEHKDDKCWFITLSDGQYETVSGIDELKDDEDIGGFMTFEEAKAAFLSYDLHKELEYAIEADGPENYYEGHVQLNCMLDITEDDDGELDWNEDEMIADREIIYDPENPENNIEEELDLDTSDTDLGGYKLSEDQLVDISYLKDKYMGEFVFYNDSYDNKRYDDLNGLWNSYPHDNEEGQWYIFKVKDNDDFLHDYNTKYPYVIVYQIFDENIGPKLSGTSFGKGQGVGRISEELFNMLGIEKASVPEIDLQVSSNINEDVDLELDTDEDKKPQEDNSLDLEASSDNAQTKTLFEDDKWKVELPLNYLGIVKLSIGTDWGFEEQMYANINSNDNFDPNDSYQQVKWNNYKTYIFTNKENGDKFIYCPDRWNLPGQEAGHSFSGYGWLFDKDRKIIDLHKGWRDSGARILSAWLETLDDIKLQKWACTKWPAGMADLRLTIKAKELAQSLNYTLTYGSEEYKKIHDSSTWYNEDVYRAKELITTVIIPEDTTELITSAFSDFKSLKSIKLPKKLKEIPNYCFSECRSLENINIPRVTKIGEGAFRDCSSLKSITIPTSVKNIGQRAFSECTSLESLYIPKQVIYLGQNIVINAPSVKVYCEVEDWPETWDKNQKMSRFNSTTESNFIFGVSKDNIPQNTVVEEELDLEPSPQVDWKQGQAEFHNKLKQEAKDNGVEISNITNMYPSRLDCVWTNDYTIKINDRWSIVVYSAGDMEIYETNDEEGKYPIYTEKDLEEHGIFTDDDYYELVGYDDDKPFQIGDGQGRYCGFYIDDDYAGETYYSYDMGYDDNYSMNEMPSIEEFVKKIFPEFLEEEELELEMPKDEDDKEEVEEDLELEPTTRVSDKASKEHEILTPSQKLVIRDCYESYYQNLVDKDEMDESWMISSMKWLDDVLKLPEIFIDSAWSNDFDDEVGQWNCDICMLTSDGELEFLYDMPMEVYEELIEENVIDEVKPSEYEPMMHAI